MAQPAPSPLELDSKYDDYDFPTTAPVAQNGHPGFLTAQQQAQVHQLRLLLEKEGYTKRLDTLTLVRPASSDCYIPSSGMNIAADGGNSCASCALASLTWNLRRRCETSLSNQHQHPNAHQA
jgi:hypothetical protein